MNDKSENKLDQDDYSKRNQQFNSTEEPNYIDGPIPLENEYELFVDNPYDHVCVYGPPVDIVPSEGILYPDDDDLVLDIGEGDEPIINIENNYDEKESGDTKE